MQKKKGFVHIFLIFITTLLFLFIALYISIFNRSKVQDVTPLPLRDSRIVASPTTLMDGSDWGIPDLPYGFNWQTKNLDKDDAADYRMFWEVTGDDSSFGEIPFPTLLHFTELNYENSKDIIDYRSLINKFGDEMKSKGWSFEAYYGNKRIMGAAADGVFGSLYGTVKIKDTKIRSVGYSYNLSPASWEGPGSDIVCPCQLRLEVFVGDEVDLNEI